MLRQYKLKDYNFRLIIWLVTLSTLGVLLVGSAEPSLQGRQLAGVMLGLSIMFIISLTEKHSLSSSLPLRSARHTYIPFPFFIILISLFLIRKM